MVFSFSKNTLKENGFSFLQEQDERKWILISKEHVVRRCRNTDTYYSCKDVQKAHAHGCIRDRESGNKMHESMTSTYQETQSHDMCMCTTRRIRLTRALLRQLRELLGSARTQETAFCVAVHGTGGMRHEMTALKTQASARST
jgi:hypothetical protein